jgi:hypothetical protein
LIIDQPEKTDNAFIFQRREHLATSRSGAMIIDAQREDRSAGDLNYSPMMECNGGRPLNGFDRSPEDEGRRSRRSGRRRRGILRRRLPTVG